MIRARGLLMAALTSGSCWGQRPRLMQSLQRLSTRCVADFCAVLVETEQFLFSFFSRPRFRMQDYDLLRHNCNNFTNECSKFLLAGKGIPQDILDLPNRALSTPLGQMMRPQIEAYQQSVVQVRDRFGCFPPVFLKCVLKKKQYAGVDADITRASSSNPHSVLHVPLFVQGKPIAFTSGSLDKAVERLGQVFGLVLCCSSVFLNKKSFLVRFCASKASLCLRQMQCSLWASSPTLRRLGPLFPHRN